MRYIYEAFFVFNDRSFDVEASLLPYSLAYLTVVFG